MTLSEAITAAGRSPLDLPIPHDPELRRLHEQAVYNHWYEAAQIAIEETPHAAARLIAYVWHHRLIQQQSELRQRERCEAA